MIKIKKVIPYYKLKKKKEYFYSKIHKKIVKNQ